MNCKEASEASIKKTEGKLSLKDRWNLWLHVMMCKYCMLFHKQQAWISKAFASNQSNAAFSTEEKEVLKSTLRNEV